MRDLQREQNPDVNSYVPDDSGVDDANDDSSDIERPKDDETIPVPPDVQPREPIKEPPGRDGPPMGDVDDSPKRIADK